MDELQFQTQMAKDTDEVAEYYRRLLLEARAERDAAIADAVKLARLVEEYPDVLLDEDRDLLEEYLNK